MQRGKRFAGWCDMSRWIKCSDRLPDLDDDGYSERVLALNSDEDIIFSWIVNHDWEFGEDITHWMPLPELPKD